MSEEKHIPLAIRTTGGQEKVVMGAIIKAISLSRGFVSGIQGGPSGPEHGQSYSILHEGLFEFFWRAL